MFAQLGPHIFEGIKSPSTLSDSRSVRYGRISMIAGKDALQYTGEESKELSLSINLDIAFCDVEAEIDALQDSMTSAEVLPFVMGNGRIVGNYVITDIDITTQRSDAIGRREAAVVSISLLETTTTAVKSTLPVAVIPLTSSEARIMPTPQMPALPVNRASQSIMSHVGKGREGVKKMQEAVAAVKKEVKSYKRAVREVKDTADTISDAYNRAKTTVEATKKIIERAKELPTSLSEAIEYANDLSQIDSTIDSVSLDMKIAGLTSSAATVDAQATSVVAFAATKEGGK